MTDAPAPADELPLDEWERRSAKDQIGTDWRSGLAFFSSRDNEAWIAANLSALIATVRKQREEIERLSRGMALGEAQVRRQAKSIVAAEGAVSRLKVALHGAVDVAMGFTGMAQPGGNMDFGPNVAHDMQHAIKEHVARALLARDREGETG